MTHLVVSGLNYHSTPLAIRERITIPESCVKHALTGLSYLPHVKEAAVLSTCNRTEVYAVVTDIQAGWREIDSFFAQAQAVADHAVLKPNFKLLREDVALHLLRVASGLDSLVLGEGQIMAQVKGAHQAALEAKTAGPILDQLFKLALNCGKRVRSETTMGRRAVSVSSVAVELARSIPGGLENKKLAVIGAGKMAQIVLKHLLSEQTALSVHVLNRSADKLERLAQAENRLTAHHDFAARHKVACDADIVFVSTSAPEFIIKYEEFARARSGKNRETTIIDISVPRNVDPAIGELPGVKLFHADDLSTIVNKNLQERQDLVKEAEKVVFDVLDEFHSWQRSLLIVPTITGLREKIEAIRQEQVSKSNPDGNSETGVESHRELEGISRAIVNQILHHPTVQLKATRDYQILRQQAEALRTLFNLDPLDSSARERTQTRHRRQVDLPEVTPV